MTPHILHYQDDDTLFEAYVALPATEVNQRPAVLVFHAWGGRGDFECAKADQLAALGYVGIAIDLYGKGVTGSSTEECVALMSPLMQDRAKLRKRLLCALSAVQALDSVDNQRIAAIGFCFGGLCALDLARSGAPVKGVVSFHGLLSKPADLMPGNITASILALHGHNDPMVPPEQVLDLEQELTAANADWQVHAYGGTAHAFTNPQANAPEQGMQYQPRAAKRAWASMLGFLKEVLE